jgi:drug/metabolite transporter (DMT)-like permease
MYLALGLIWGSSFLLIKNVLNAGLDTVPLVTVRLVLAALAFAIMLIVTRKALPKDRKTQLALFAIGITNTVVPFLLITWGEKYIDSGMASVLNGTVPLFSLTMAHFLLPDDRLTLRKSIGVVLGFLGVVVLATRPVAAPVAEAVIAVAEAPAISPVFGQLAVLLAAFSYAISAIIIRRYLRQVDSMVVAGGSLTIGALIMLVLMLFTVNPLPNFAALPSDALLTLLALGLLNTFVAYNLYFRVIRVWGATRSTTVTYLMPPIGILLGVLFAKEKPDITLFIGAGLIICGVIFANQRKTSAGGPASIQNSATVQTRIASR